MRALQVKAKRVHAIWGACANSEAMETSTRPKFRSMRQSLGESGNESFIPTRGFPPEILCEPFRCHESRGRSGFPGSEWAIRSSPEPFKRQALKTDQEGLEHCFITGVTMIAPRSCREESFAELPHVNAADRSSSVRTWWRSGVGFRCTREPNSRPSSRVPRHAILDRNVSPIFSYNRRLA
jgi:hypothetical protein